MLNYVWKIMYRFAQGMAIWRMFQNVVFSMFGNGNDEIIININFLNYLNSLMPLFIRLYTVDQNLNLKTKSLKIMDTYFTKVTSKCFSFTYIHIYVLSCKSGGTKIIMASQLHFYACNPETMHRTSPMHASKVPDLEVCLSIAASKCNKIKWFMW